MNSVLAPGVAVGEGAVVRDAIILHDTVIEAGARVEFAIVDRGVQLAALVNVGAPPEAQAPPKISVVGEGARLPVGQCVQPGGVVEPGGSREAEPQA